MRRSSATLFLAFVLLGLQHAAAVHGVAHLADRQPDGYTAPHAATPCAACELLASGGQGVPAPAAATPAPGASLLPAAATFESQPAAVPASYSSRAPPRHS